MGWVLGGGGGGGGAPPSLFTKVISVHPHASSGFTRCTGNPCPANPSFFRVKNGVC